MRIPGKTNRPKPGAHKGQATPTQAPQEHERATKAPTQTQHRHHHTRTHRAGVPGTRKEPPKEKSRGKSQTVVVDDSRRRSATVSRRPCRASRRGPDRSAAAAIGGTLFGNGRHEFRRNPRKKTRRTPSRTSPPRHAHHHVRRVDTRCRPQLSWAWRCPRKCSPCSRRQEGGTCPAART